MSILGNADTKVIAQGKTGETGTSYAEQAQSNFTVSVDAVTELLEACKGIDSSLA